MPTFLNADPNNFPIQRGVVVGEPRTAAEVRPLCQDMADRTEHVRDRLTYIDPTREGARRLRSFASVGALKAASDAPDKSIAKVEGVGVYQYDAASSAAADDLTVLAPSTLPGRWVILGHGRAMLGGASGIPQLDGSGKLATSQLAAANANGKIAGTSIQNGVVDLKHAFAATPSNAASGAWVDVGPVLTFTAAEGDLLELAANYALDVPNSVTSESRILITRPDASTVEADAALTTHVGTASTLPRYVTGKHLQPTHQAGAHTMRVQHRVSAGTGTVTAYNVAVSALVIRP